MELRVQVPAWQRGSRALRGVWTYKGFYREWLSGEHKTRLAFRLLSQNIQAGWEGGRAQLE